MLRTTAIPRNGLFAAGITGHSKPVHLVLLNQYFPPDEAPTGLMLEAVAAALVEGGHEVTILCAEGGYAGTGEMPKAEPVRGVTVVRLGTTRFGRGTFIGKLADYASYYLGVAWKLLALHPKPDRVVALTTPPYLSVLARIVTRFRKADHAHWVMDLYPDVMIAHGMLREGGLAHRILSALARFGFGGERSAAVVTLGPDMAERVSRHLAPGRMADWVPLWGTEDGNRKSEEELEAGGRALRRERGWADDELILMYSGNMGLGHRFGEFLEAAAAFSSTDLRSPFSRLRPPRFVFFGGGKRRGEIEEFIRRHPAAPVELHDYVPRHLLAAHLRSADVHLASLEPSWTGAMLPSKLQGIFAAARPVIFVGSPASSTARWIEESGGGWGVEAGDGKGLRGVLDAAADQAARQRAGAAARRFHQGHFDCLANAARLAEAFSKSLAVDAEDRWRAPGRPDRRRARERRKP